MMKKIAALICFICVLTCMPAFAKGKAAKNVKKEEPVVEKPIVPNFENKRAEIIEVLNLEDKQKAKAEALYEKSRTEILQINNELKNQYDKKKELKLSREDAKIQLEKMIKINNQIEVLYQKRDKLHNETLKKFENILNKDQLGVWNDIKLKGVRFFPEMDEIN